MRPIVPDRSLFDRLADASGDDVLVSLYLPTHVRGSEIQQDAIRLKNQLAEAHGWLEEAGWSPRRRDDRLSDAGALLEDQEFWRHQSAALGVLVDGEGKTSPVALAESTESLVVVADRFHLRPLLSSLQVAILPVLVLTEGGVRLYRSSRYEAEEVQADLPRSFQDVNWFVDREKQRQQHPDMAGTERSRHGHEPSARREEDRRRFLREVAHALPKLEGPLVVLGDDNLIARFDAEYGGEVCSPDNSGIGHVDDADEVRRSAAAVIADEERSARQEALDRVGSALGTGGATSETAEALKAAVEGRLGEVVLYQHASPKWGRFDPASLEVTYHERQEFGSVDLLDRLCVHALHTGANVTVVDTPVNGHPFSAIPRY